MIDKKFLEQAEALNFRDLMRGGRVVSDNPEIWVKDCGALREMGTEFYLSFGASRIGFREPPPDSRSRAEALAAAAPAPQRTKTWVLEKVGCAVTGWEGDSAERRTVAEAHRFRNRDEQNFALALIFSALSRHVGMYYAVSGARARVLLTVGLEQALADGSLIVDSKATR
jgi:hypothetical protein